MRRLGILFISVGAIFSLLVTLVFVGALWTTASQVYAAVGEVQTRQHNFTANQLDELAKQVGTSSPISDKLALNAAMSQVEANNLATASFVMTSLALLVSIGVAVGSILLAVGAILLTAVSTKAN